MTIPTSVHILACLVAMGLMACWLKVLRTAFQSVTNELLEQVRTLGEPHRRKNVTPQRGTTNSSFIVLALGVLTVVDAGLLALGIADRLMNAKPSLIQNIFEIAFACLAIIGLTVVVAGFVYMRRVLKR